MNVNSRENEKSVMLKVRDELVRNEHAHFHPSGIPEPSQEDIDVTKRLEEAGRLLGIGLLYHIILGEDGQYVSLQEEKRFKKEYINVQMKENFNYEEASFNHRIKSRIIYY
jgi:DNA repair protein RadC